VTSKLFWIFII